MIKSVLFDLDGTLTDPKPGITGCIRYALEKLGQKAAAARGRARVPPVHDRRRRALAADPVSGRRQGAGDAGARWRARHAYGARRTPRGRGRSRIR